MLTVKRLYIYGVLGVSLVLLLWGLTNLLRFVFDELAGALGISPVYAGALAAEELSLAVALTLVAGSMYLIHLALLRRALRGSGHEAADERASGPRGVYFLLALAGTGAVLALALVELIDALVTGVVFDQRGVDVIGPAATAIVVGTAWVWHVLARRTDLWSAPRRMAHEWLTRVYLYGALLITALLGAVVVGETLATIARLALDLPPAFASPDWWQDAIGHGVAGTCVLAAAWVIHFVFAQRLCRAPDPLGPANQAARTRSGSFLAVVLVSTGAVLVLGTAGLQHVFAELLGAWVSTEGSSLVEDIGGPALLLLPFLGLWWWHLRRVTSEASLTGGPEHARAVMRTGRLLVALVGLVGLAVGTAWSVQVLVDAMSGADAILVDSGAALRDLGAPALAAALVGLILWVPAWARSQAERAANALEAATATSRRAYLLLVSGPSVVAAMGSLAYLIWQATRVLLDSGQLDDVSWAASILLVAVTVLIYHLWQLRRDVVVGQAAVSAGPARPGELPAGRAVETIEIIAPAGADFRVLNAAIRSELPDGYELHVVG